MFSVWKRNFLVWKKLALPSMIGNLLDPLFYMLALGYGLGSFIDEINNISYIAFIATGTVCYGTLNSATFEILYSTFSRMHVQKSWDAILITPVRMIDIVNGEILWATTKSVLSGSAIMLVMFALNILNLKQMFFIFPLIILIGVTFSCMGFVITSVSKSYDFFMYYFTLVITPMLLISGVFFPTEKMPIIIQKVSEFLPLKNAIDIVRFIVFDQSSNLLKNFFILILISLVCYILTIKILRKRLYN
ncbi:MAG: ABC transporter permease [Hydrogenophilales bacterium]